MTRKDIFARCLLFAFIVLLGLGAFFIFRYIHSLEQQVYERDALIRELSISDQLVQEYFDIQIDTLGHSRSYKLKDDKKTRIIERQEHYAEIDGKKYNFDQLLNQYIILVQKYNNMVDDYNTLANDFDRSNHLLTDSRQAIRSINRTVDSLQTSLRDQQYFLNTIAREYGIICNVTREGNTITYSMRRSPQLDSALRIYPYFKDLAKYNKDTKAWVISIPSNKNIDKIVEITQQETVSTKNSAGID